MTNSGNQKHLAAFMRTVALLLAVSLVAACGKAEPTPQASEASSGTMLNAAQTHAATPQTYSWNLADLYADAPAWQQEYNALDADLVALDDWRGGLCADAAALADAADLASRLGKRVMRLYVYAQLKADEDTRVQSNLARFQLAKQLYMRYGEVVAWMRPEIIAAGADRIESFIAAEPRLAIHAVMLRDSLRNAAHTLDADGERILSAARLPLSGAQTIYTQMSASDIPWPSLVIDASEVRIDNQGYGLHRQNPDRAIRRQVFESFFGTWKQYESAIGQTLAAQVQARVFEARMRNFSSAREAALFVDNLPVAIYDRLIEQAHAGLPVLHRYFRLRARMLGVDDLAYHDIYPELVSVPGLSYTLDEAKTLTRQALAPFGPEYLAVLDSGFEGDWMHAFPQEGKRSGAYVFGSAYDVHPYVLLNHQDDFDSLSTFAHEWGHAVHSVLSNQSQPWETAGYATFVAEMASTINSILLLQKLQAEAGSDRQRLYFLAQELETYRATFFRQAMFAEFEASIHAAAEAGEALTGERFTAMYLELLRRYHGSDEGVMSIDPRYALEWAYIPHFYRNFYVFQYATSVTASTAFASRLVGPEGVQARKDVIGMLRKGSSEYPHAMFVAAGVDLSEPGPYQTVFARMNAIMDEMERLDGAARS